MTELPRRTGLRSNPEDAAFYRKHRDASLGALRKGLPRDQLLLDLATKGVPAGTAERIVIAVEQELAAKTARPGLSRGKRWAIIAFTATFFGAVTAFILWQMSRDRTLSLKYAAPGLIVIVVASAIVVQRLLLKIRGPVDLPPPR